MMPAERISSALRQLRLLEKVIPYLAGDDTGKEIIATEFTYIRAELIAVEHDLKNQQEGLSE